MIGDPSNAKRFGFIRAAIERACSEDWRQARILDLGCGPGPLAEYLGGHGCRRVCGVDLDPLLVAAAEVRCSDYGHEFHVARIEDFLGRSNVRGDWDCVVLSEVLMHLADPVGALGAIRERLAPTGSLVITIPNGFGPWERYHRFSERRLYRRGESAPDGKRLVHRYRHRDLVRTVEALDFQLQSFGRSNFISGVYPFNVPGYHSFDFVERFDCWLADRLPSSWVSGWYFAFGLTFEAPVARIARGAMGAPAGPSSTRRSSAGGQPPRARPSA